MNQQKNFREKEQQKNKGSLTLEASIVLVFFLVAYMAILSVINMYRGQVLIQNAANQTAQEIAQYTYLLKKAGLSEFGKQASDNATKFTDDTNKLVGTVFAFFEATSEGLDAGKEIANDMQTQTFPEDIFQLSSQLEDMQENADTIEKQADNIYSEYRTMMDAGAEYFSDPAAIFNGMLAILKDTTCDSIKIAVATPITKSLMNKYLAAYPADHLENLGVVGGNDGISYWGSSILLDMQSVEVCAYYKMKIELPFLDLFEYQLKTTSSTRAWIGDGTHNDNGGSDSGRGVELDPQALGKPGMGGSGDDENAAGNSVEITAGGTTVDSSFSRLNTTVSNITLPTGTWQKGPTERGKDIDELLGNNVGDNYPTIDIYDLETGRATSIKSRDLTASSYQNGNTLERTIKKDIDKLADFELVDWGGSYLEGRPINQRALQIVVPNVTMTDAQIQAINNAIEYAGDKGVEIIITIGL